MSDSNTTSNSVPNQAGARDILIFRGAEYWPTPEDVIREVHAQGLSVRIPRNNIPSGLVKGLSRIALGHIKAVMTIENGTEDDLRAAFEALGDPEVDAVLARTYEHAPSRWLEMPDASTEFTLRNEGLSTAKREIFERFGVTFSPGIFAYCYYSGATYYLKPDETEAPEDLAAKGVVAVRGVIADIGEFLPLTDETKDKDEEE